MAWQDVVTLATLAAVVLGIFFGRRKGRARFASAMSAARAEGHAAATAELSAKLVNQVQVIAGNSLPGESPRETDALISALRLIAVESERASMRPLDVDRGRHDMGSLLSGRRGNTEPDDEFADFRSARGSDWGDSSRGVGDGAAMTEPMLITESLRQVLDDLDAKRPA